ncbi:YpiF family protein [Paenibacillus soyae]|uniref:YpiF family protein n=1 Tax=Paenibacillus soyae TaxID=2969249 RepID=A0A9X2MJI9_9BACL|nr:YpiF family protein [Paenibacillus soyae]MCR2802993.1 YpiF family protein [Paenibacillus soyae]
MKFSDILGEQWDELKPYLDTCLLPVTGLDGNEAPHEATEKLEKLRDLMDLIEIPFKGRVVTYPASHYVESFENAGESLAGFCRRLRSSGFAFIILASANPEIKLGNAGADLVIQPGSEGEWPEAGTVSSSIRELWSRTSP